MKQSLVAFGVGMLFACGLGLSEMTNPQKIINFLDIAGNWDPSLALVMIGALVVFLPTFQLSQKRPAPLVAKRWQLPTKRKLDRPLIIGALLFGIGWGLGGFCPAPAITALGYGYPAVGIFVSAMIAGALLHRITS